MKENKSFSPSFDIFSPLVKASFQQFGTFLLMLMLPTRNSISFHFVPPPSPDDRGGHRVQNPTFVQPKADKGWKYSEKSRMDWIWVLRPGFMWATLALWQNNWNIPPQVDVFPQASCGKKGSYSRKPAYLIFILVKPAKLICLHMTPLKQIIWKHRLKGTFMKVCDLIKF